MTTCRSYALNVKGIPHTTEWIECPDIAPLSQKLGYPPTETRDGSPLYTIPFIYDPNTQQRIADSKAIVKYLDKAYPDTPQLFPKGLDALQQVFLDAIGAGKTEIDLALYMTVVYANSKILAPQSAEYWVRTRSARFGKPLEQLATEENWKVLEAGLGKVKGWLESNEDGEARFFMGDRIIFADLQLVALLKWIKTVDAEAWARIGTLHDSKWAGILQQFAQYETIV